MRSNHLHSVDFVCEKNAVPQKRVKLWGAALAAGFLTLLVHLGVAWGTNKYPFGKISSAVGDMAWQFQAFYSSVHDLVSSSGEVGLTYNWHGGLGYPFLADYSTYIGGVFPWFTLLFPDGYSELAMFTVLMLKLALASALLAVLLLMLRPEQKWFLAAGIGALYGTSGWVMDAGIHRIMWDDGLLGLPLFAIIALIGHRRRLFVPGAVGVALIWWGNYYSAFYASIGAALFLLSYLFAHSTPLSLVFKRVALFGLQGVLGVLLTSVTLLPTYLAVSTGVDQAGRPFKSYDYSHFILRMLPMVVDDYLWIGTSVGSVGIILILFYIVTPKISLRSKLSWLVPVVFILASYSSHGAMLAWNLGDWPNGSWYRSSFILVFFFVVIAWQGLAALRLVTIVKYNLYIWFAVTAILVIMLLLALPARSEVADVPKYALASLVLVGVLCAVASLSRKRLVVSVLVVLLFVSTGAELVVGGSQIRLLQAKYLAVSKVRDLELPSYVSALAEYRNSSTSWPWTRLGQRQDGIPYNDGTWSHYPSSTFYSSISHPIIGKTLFEMLGYSGTGRFFSTNYALDLDVISAVSGNLVKENGEVTYSQHPTFPLVRQISISPAGAEFIRNPKSSADVFHNRSLLLGNVYSHVLGVSENGGNPRESFTNPRSREIVVQCASGTIATPSFFGVDYSFSRTPIEDSSNRWKFVLSRPLGKKIVNSDSFRCVNKKSLLDITENVWQYNAPTKLAINGSTISAIFSKNTDFPVVIATAAYPGWQCLVDGKSANLSNLAGLLTVKDTQWKDLSCKYSTRGLVLGTAVSIIVFIFLLGIQICGFFNCRNLFRKKPFRERS